jgi:diguanylate cyclase (GGDEF)-like protein
VTRSRRRLGAPAGAPAPQPQLDSVPPVASAARAEAPLGGAALARSGARGPLVDVRARWRAGHAALALAGVMTVAALARPLAPGSSQQLKLAVTLILGLGVAATALLASLRGRGRAEQFALYAFLVLSLDGFTQMLQPLGWPTWPLFALLLGALAVAEALPVALALAALASLLAVADAAATSFDVWRGAVAASFGYAALVGAVHVALAGEKRRLVRTTKELDNLRYGFDPLEQNDKDIGTVRSSLRRVSERGRRALHQESAAELELVLKRLVRVARAALKAHAVLYFQVDRERGQARLLAWDGAAAIDATAAVGLGQDPFGFVLDRRVPFYATDFKRLLWALPYYKGEVRIGTLLAVPVFSGEIVSGVLIADRLETQALTGDEPEILDGFAALAADSSKQVHSVMEREETGAELTAVYHVSDRLAARLTRAELVEELLSAAGELTGFDAAALLMVDEEQTRYRVVEGFGWPQEYRGREVALVENTWAGWILRGQDPLLIEDLAGQRGQLPLLVLDEGSGRAQSLLAIPLKIGRAHDARRDSDRRLADSRVVLIGAFLLMGPRGAFDAVARRVLGLLANQAAATLRHIQLTEREKSQAARDGLTGLYNRRAFEEHLAHALAAEDRRSQGRFVLLLLDIDHFKKLNDTYGHPAGDAALRNTARVIQRQIRSADVPARFGGEEFAVIMPATDEPGALRVAERVRRALEKDQIVFEGARIQVTASLGVACWPRDARDAAAVVAAADRALYAAKANGRNRVVAASQLPPESPAAAS